jgi:hypothetical protein
MVFRFSLLHLPLALQKKKTPTKSAQKRLAESQN